MEKYKDINRDSGILGYEINATSITVFFKESSGSYKYTYQSAGTTHVENMKRLALAGNGLNAYINKHVKYKYVR